MELSDLLSLAGGAASLAALAYGYGDALMRKRMRDVYNPDLLWLFVLVIPSGAAALAVAHIAFVLGVPWGAIRLLLTPIAIVVLPLSIAMIRARRARRPSTISHESAQQRNGSDV